MSEVRQVGSLEIDQDLEFQRREWRVQRVLWIVGVALLVLALMGLFGGGPISSTTQQSSDGSVSVDYHRFVRHDGRAALHVQVDAAHASNQEVAVWIDHRFLDRVHIESVSPQPASVQGDNGRLVYAFELADGSETLNVTFSYRPQHIGRIGGDIGSGDAAVDIDQIGYP